MIEKSNNLLFITVQHILNETLAVFFVGDVQHGATVTVIVSKVPKHVFTLCAALARLLKEKNPSLVIISEGR